MNSSDTAVGGTLIFLAAILFMTAMWVVNLVKFVQLDFQAPYKAEVIRGTGIGVAPLCIITGLMDIGEEGYH